MSTDCEHVGVVGMEALSHEAGGEGGEEESPASIHFSHSDPILRNDAVLRGQWRWIPREANRCRAGSGSGDILGGT